MKYVKYFLVISFFHLYLLSSYSQNALMPDQLLMTHQAYIKGNFATCKDTIALKNYISLVINKTLNGEFEGIDYLPSSLYPYNYLTPNKSPLSKEQILENLDMFDEKAPLPMQEIKSLNIVESWDLNEKNFTMHKDVKAIMPIRHYYQMDEYGYTYEDEVMKIVFTLTYPKKKAASGNKKLITEIAYPFNLYNRFVWPLDKKYHEGERMNMTEKEGCPFWNSYSREKFVKVIFDQVMSQKSKAYDYETGAVLDTTDIVERMGATYEMETMEGIKMTIHDLLPLYEIHAVLFIEEWYYDENTLELSKKVIGVAPVRRYFMDESDEPYGLDVVFVTYFNEG